MAYASVVSLKQTIHRLLKPPKISILESAYDCCSSLQQILERLQSRISDSSNIISERVVKALSEEIREAACKLEDALESHVSNQFLYPQYDEGLVDDDLGKVIKQEVNSFKETAKKIEQSEYHQVKDEPESSNTMLGGDDTVDFGGQKSTDMVGLSDEFWKMKFFLTDGQRRKGLFSFSLVGTAGIGKTALARKLFEDESILRCFSHCAFVTLGPKYQIKEIILDILSQMNHYNHERRMPLESLGIALHHHLNEMKYLIVLDDVWDKKCWDQLSQYLPDDRKGSRVLLTSRLEKVANYIAPDRVYRIPFLNLEESWILLCEEVFGKHQSCPPQLEKDGKKIANNCEGLPLTIITVARFLSKADKTPEYWKEVAEKKNSVFTDAYDQMYKVLLPSYYYLPQHLKACFLYMGAFPENCKVIVSKLIKLWIAEGFLESNVPQQNLEDFAKECLEDLVSRSLVLVRQQSPIFGTTACSVLSVYCYLCVKEAGNEKFLHVLNSYADSSTENINGQRRLCIHNNVLFGIKEVYDSMASISMARSLLCTGAPHPYPLPMLCSLWKLLKVLDALTIRFYKFPIEVLELVQLRYLALIYSGKIPPSISKLWNLQYLIVERHMSIISSGGSLYLPIEIWNMHELRCLQVMGRDLPHHDLDVALSLPNLLTLSYMSADKCTKEMLEKTPNLKKLGIQIELAPSDIVVANHPLNCFDHLAHLHQLETLKCVIVNPNPTSQVIALPAFFPCSLKKLSLSGLGYPWEYMRVIGELPNLEVLKLRSYAFQGPEWLIDGYKFLELKFLLIEDIDMVCWRAHYSCFPKLERLIIRHCYKLKKILIDIIEVGLQIFELVDCPSALAFVEAIQKEYRRYLFLEPSPVFVQSSWNERKSRS